MRPATPLDEDLSLHPSEQKSFVRDPESMGTRDHAGGRHPGSFQYQCKSNYKSNRRSLVSARDDIVFFLLTFYRDLLHCFC